MTGDRSLFDDPGQAWKPYQPGTDSPWNAARVAHLHRRAGFGATWGQIERGLAEGFEPSIRRVLEGDSVGPGGQPASDFAETVAAMEDSARRRPSIERAQMLWLYRFLFTPHPLAEVMTLAWHSHYAASQSKVNSPELMLEQNLKFRKLWRAPISQLHHMVLADGAMLRWLDGLNSTKAQPNENLAREFLELFALGEGQFTERDVREVARAFTGWRGNNFTGSADTFDPGDHDDGAKTILGQTGAWSRDDVVRIACCQRAAATHIARRLYRSFVSDTNEPKPDLLAPLADAMRTDGDVDVARGLEIVLRSRLFHSDLCRSKRIKSPVAFAIGALRACEAFAVPRNLVDLEIHLTKMGQRLFYPPNVAGWPGGMAWLRGPTVLARANFAAWLIEPSSGLGPEHFQNLARRRGLDNEEAWQEAMTTLLLGSSLSQQRRSALLSELEPFQPALRHAQMMRQLLTMPEAQVG
jgi:uncharacterized protein (DUF1800 family)